MSSLVKRLRDHRCTVEIHDPSPAEAAGRIERLTDRLAIVREWAEDHPYSGLQDAPAAVRRALGYRGRGAKVLRERLDRRFGK